MDFQKKLEYAANKNKSFVCVGLDSNLDLIPSFINKGKLPQAVFNKKIVDATADLVCAYKPNAAFYEQNGSDGIAALKSTCDYIRKRYPEIPIILDAKRADIDSTNNGYAEFAFGYLKVDAITIHPYLGRESVESFLKYREKGIFVLCRTSNQGAGEFQDLIINKKPYIR
jgi:orotidine-5'-phosphate decarboxylase